MENEVEEKRCNMERDGMIYLCICMYYFIRKIIYVCSRKDYEL